MTILTEFSLQESRFTFLGPSSLTVKTNHVLIKNNRRKVKCILQDEVQCGNISLLHFACCLRKAKEN